MATTPPFIPGASGPPSDSAPHIRRTRRSELAIWWREIDRVAELRADLTAGGEALGPVHDEGCAGPAQPGVALPEPLR